MLIFFNITFDIMSYNISLFRCRTVISQKNFMFIRPTWTSKVAKIYIYQIY